MTSLDGINGWSIQTLLRGENDSKQSDEFQATHPRKFGNHVTDRPSDRPSAPQAYQCLLSHFLATLRAQEKADFTSMLSSIDSCQNRVSADQFHMIVSWAQVSTHLGRVFFEVIRWQFTRFQMITGSHLLFLKNSYQICCVYVSIAPHYYDFDFKLTSNAKIPPVFLKYRWERPFLTMVTCWSRSTSNFYALIG